MGFLSAEECTTTVAVYSASTSVWPALLSDLKSVTTTSKRTSRLDPHSAPRLQRGSTPDEGGRFSFDFARAAGLLGATGATGGIGSANGFATGSGPPIS